ncbi:phosphotransferase (plasmid) [Embleya sp. NBC_00888]|uniref:phosphotransferase enzyme family protein n=1 Tax=Embleya sp. NBC_00888 TaxID=2975960 RepID=UPI002F919765|nr:phosphotransferase [Embleya sp. NBC_00888]
MTLSHPRIAPPTHDDIAAVLEEYRLRPRAVRPLDGGMENTHLRAETQDGTVVVTLLRKKDAAATEEYTRFLCHLDRAGAPVPRLRQRRDGGWVGACAGYPVIVCDFVRGHQHTVLPPARVEEVGTILGRVHSTASVPDCTLVPRLRLSGAEAVLLADLPDNAFSRWARATHRAVAHVTEQSAQLVPVHADTFPDNVVITPQGEVVLLDWEDGSLDLPAIDVGMALIGLCCPDGFCVPRARRLLRGYRAGGGPELAPRLVRDAALHAAVLVALRRYQWQRTGNLPADPSRTHTALVRAAQDLERRWPEVTAG